MVTKLTDLWINDFEKDLHAIIIIKGYSVKIKTRMSPMHVTRFHIRRSDILCEIKRYKRFSCIVFHTSLDKISINSYFVIATKSIALSLFKSLRCKVLLLRIAHFFKAPSWCVTWRQNQSHILLSTTSTHIFLNLL